VQINGPRSHPGCRWRIRRTSRRLSASSEIFPNCLPKVVSYRQRAARSVCAIAEDRAYSLKDYFTRSRFSPAGKKQVTPKSAMQRKYVETIQQKDIVFGIGPAGTGKTYLGVAMAVQALMQKQVNRIVLARPAVEAGEKLGFLPATCRRKSILILRPLYDALFDLVDYERVTRLLEKRVIEIARWRS